MGVSTLGLEELAAKQAITEVIHRYCRSMDRMDKDIGKSCWHPGGTCDYAPLYQGPFEGFIEWLWPVHAAMLATRHAVSNTLIELNGDRAGAETYVSVILRVPQDGKVFDIVSSGRYLDQFERIGGVWAIRHRAYVLDWDRVDPVEMTLANFSDTPLIPPNNPGSTPRTASRDRSDHSYTLIGHLAP